MAHIYDRVLSLVTKPPAERKDSELEDVVPWFKKKADKLFKDIQNQIIKDIVKNAEFRKCNPDFVIVRQGEKGDEFFIMLRGTAGVHINSNLAEEEVEVVHRKQMQEEAIHRENVQGKPLDRSLYGVHVTDVCTGKSFGELALINPECTRNATIIASELCELLVVSRDLYNKTLHAFQAREFAEKQRFVADFPLFHKWNTRYRKMAAMSLVKVIVKFEDTIVKQGMTVDGLHFVISGELKIRVDPSQHPSQYPQHFPVGDIAELEKEKARELLRKEMNLERHRSTGKKSAFERRSTTAHVDKKNSSLRPMDLCLMGAIDTIGDLEMVQSLSTYSQTVICMEEATIFHLDQKNYDRLVEKRNPQTVDIMRDIVHTKLTLHFSRLSDDSIPLYRYILYTLDEKERELREQQQQQMRARGRQTSGSYGSETEWQIDNLHKGPLVNLYGPGSVFYLIRMKAKERQQRQQREKATPSGNNAFRVAQQQQSHALPRGPLDNSRFLYEDDTASISDGHIVNIYGYSDNQAVENGDNDNTQRAPDPAAGYMSEEEVDYATSDTALTHLEERLQQWHSSLDSAASSGTSPPAGGVTLNTGPGVLPAGVAAGNISKAGHSVVRLHRFHVDDENRPKPGNKVYVKGRVKGRRLTVSTALLDDAILPEDDKRPKISPLSSRSPLSREPLFDINSNELPGNMYEDPSNMAVSKGANSAGPLWGHTFATSFKKPQSQRKHQYTKEEYQALKEELRRRQRAYKSFLSQRAGTSLY